MNKGSIVERLCSDLIAKNRDINGLLYFTLLYKFLQERVLMHDAADSANWQTLCALQIFCIVYCIVLYCIDGPFPVTLVRFMTKLL